MSDQSTAIPFSEENLSLSRWVQNIQECLHRHHGVNEIYIGGGSSRTLLDHALNGSSTEMRDLDLFVIAGRPVVAEDLFPLIQTLEEQYLVQRGKHAPRSKLRFDPKIPKGQDRFRSPGFGVHLKKEGQPILSLSLLEQEEDLLLNGILIFDRIFLRLNHRENIADLIRDFSRFDPENLPADPRLLDPLGGYARWRHKEVDVINWDEIERNPVRSTLRVCRSFAKVGAFTPSPEIRAGFRRILDTEASHRPDVEGVRTFLKILHDTHALRELCLLQDLGCLKLVSKSIDAEIEFLRASEEVASLAKKLRRAGSTRASLREVLNPEYHNLLEMVDVATTIR